MYFSFFLPFWRIETHIFIIRIRDKTKRFPFRQYSKKTQAILCEHQEYGVVGSVSDENGQYIYNVYGMSHLIDLEQKVIVKLGGSSTQQNRHSINYTKLQRTVSAAFQQLAQNFRVGRVVHTNGPDQFECTIEITEFYLFYSVVGRLVFRPAEGRMLMTVVLARYGAPHILVSKNIRIAATHLLNDIHAYFPDFVVSLDPANGSIFIRKSVILWDGLVNAQDLRQTIGNFTRFLREQKDKTIKIINVLTGEQLCPTIVDKNWSIVHKVIKYLRISSLADLEVSETDLGQLKQSHKSQSIDKSSFVNQAQLESSQYQLRQLSLLFTPYAEEVNISGANLALTDHQLKELAPFLKFPKARIMNQVENQFIFNEIIVQNPQKVNLINSNIIGGNTQLFIAKLSFEYSVATRPGTEPRPHPRAKLQKILLVKSPKNKVSQRCLEHEFKIVNSLKSCSSAYMIKYYKTETPILKNKLLMDYMQNSYDLNRYSEKNSRTFSIMSKLLILSNLANGLRFLKKLKIVHMDLNPCNMLVGPGYLSKIIDFGESYCERICGPGYYPGFTNPYGAPEALTEKHFDIKQDVFSLGMILFKTLQCRLPFEASQQLKQCYRNRIYTGRLFLALESAQYTWLQTPMQLLISLFCRCISTDPARRPDPTWIRIILRLVMGWYMNIFNKL